MAIITISDDVLEVARVRDPIRGGQNYERISMAEAKRLFFILHPAGGQSVLSVSDHLVQEGDGHDVGVRRLYADADVLRGVFLWIYGGGWTFEDLVTADGLCRDFAARVGYLVISATPRLAPEGLFPGALDDVLEVLTRVFEKYATDYPVAIDGGRSGGNLATTACLAIRDRDELKYEIAHQTLVFSAVDFNTKYHSARAYVDPLLNVADTFRLANSYASIENDRYNHFTALNTAFELGGIPALSILVGKADSLRDGIPSCAEHLRLDQVEAQPRTYKNVGHAFFGALGVADGGQSLSDIADDLRAALCVS